MPITFDTLDELKSFYEAFSLTGKGGSKTSRNASASVASKPARKTTAAHATKTVAPGKTTKRGRPVGTTKKVKVAKKPTEKKVTLTSKIQGQIQKFISNKKSFTANDVYAELSKKDAGVNKQSVITSVLKQMNTTFSKIKVSEQPGQGPRPVKVYLP